MTAKLKLGPLVEDRPVKLTIELPAALFADLRIYGELLGREGADGVAVEPARLVAPMLQRFMATDRGFARAKRATSADIERE